MTNAQSLRRGIERSIKPISTLIITLLVSLSWQPQAGAAPQNSPEATQLKQDAQNAYVQGRYADAVATDLEIVEKHPDSEARRYAVQMLGTIYEENLVDLKKAIKWHREFLEKYADSRQAPAYEEKLAFLEKMSAQEPAFKAWQAIRSANEGDEIMVKKYEALLKEYPDFILKDKVESELGYAYGRMDEREKSYLAFQSVASQGGENILSGTDQAAYEDAHRYWQMTWIWAWLAWAVVVSLWAAVLLMKPWKQLTWASSRKFLLWPVLWVLLVAASMPLFYSMETKGFPIVIPDFAVFIACGLNLTVLFWLLLLTRGQFWRTRPLALRFFSPLLTLLMTGGVFYLFVVYYPNGPYIIDVFTATLKYKP